MIELIGLNPLRELDQVKRLDDQWKILLAQPQLKSTINQLRRLPQYISIVFLQKADFYSKNPLTDLQHFFGPDIHIFWHAIVHYLQWRNLSWPLSFCVVFCITIVTCSIGIFCHVLFFSTFFKVLSTITHKNDMSDVQVDFENDIQKKDLVFQKQAAHNTTNVFFHGQGFFWCFTLCFLKI